MLSLAIAMVLYLLAATGADRHAELHRTSTRDRRASRRRSTSVGLSGFAKVVAVGAIVGIITVLFSFMLGASRVWYSISRDGLLPPWFAHDQPARTRRSRPVWIVGVVSAVIAGLRRRSAPPPS